MFYTSWVDYLNRTSYVDYNSPVADWWQDTLDGKVKVYGYTLWIHQGDLDYEAIKREDQDRRRRDQAVSCFVAGLRYVRDGELSEIIAEAQAKLPGALCNES